MKKKFKTDFSTDGWVKYWFFYVAVMFIFFAVYIISMSNVMSIAYGHAFLNPASSIGMRRGAEQFMGLYSLISSANIIYAIAAWLAAAFVLCKAVGFFVNSVSLDGEKFSYTGNSNELFKKMAGMIFLSLITLGIYTPWMYENVIKYIAANTKIGDKNLTFNSKGGTLLGYYAICFAVIFVLYLVVIITVFALTVYEYFFWLLFFVIFSIIGIACAFQAFFINWIANFSFGDKKISLDIDIEKSISFLIGQAVLVIVTIGFYFPAAMINTYKYFVSRLTVKKESKEIARFCVEDTSGGYGLIFGQYFLMWITMDIYMPWGYTEIIKFFVNRTSVEIKDEEAVRTVPDIQNSNGTASDSYGQ